ncbi:hypothetical protein C8A05DRAFT_35844 [Staphylotrichum tortipilum]|uniref:Uncharacterized protein n=1 Tax=Staphylotrichum tortipilum TaxID=2831512 RepID=A0AAN6MH72_9PEZI|nr:hypothetical protein C8A05DRAFT_35844 [Staphylotrichum longicolle]
MLQRLATRGKTSGRDDDQEDRAKRRIEAFKNSAAKNLLKQLSKNPIYKIDCTASIEEVQTKFRSCVEKCLGEGRKEPKD